MIAAAITERWWYDVIRIDLEGFQFRSNSRTRRADITNIVFYIRHSSCFLSRASIGLQPWSGKMASVWKGSLSFGLVNIPVELRPAVRQEHVSFRLLYKKDLSPVKYERFSSKGEGPLAWEDIVKGFEIEKGKYVVLTDADFREAALGKSTSIEILDFVELDEIDPRYFETPYYLTAAKGGEKGYALLRAAINNTGVVGIGKIVMRNTQHLVGIKTNGEAMMLEIMRFQNELVSTDEFHFPSASEVRPQELHMAEQLVHNLAADFDPAKYTDEYRANLMKLIRAKMHGKKLKGVPSNTETVHDDKVVDLMARLRQSLAEGKPRKAARSRKKAAAKAAGRASTRSTAHSTAHSTTRSSARSGTRGRSHARKSA
jgi:DNA end-binding protein Ku